MVIITMINIFIIMNIKQDVLIKMFIKKIFNIIMITIISKKFNRLILKEFFQVKIIISKIIMLNFIKKTIFSNI